MAYDYVNGSCILNTSYGTPGIYPILTDCENAVSDGSVLPILILNPTWNAFKKVILPLTIAKLGDGYQQTIFEGIDTINEEWNITSPVLLGRQAEDLLIQLRSLCATSFLWSPNNGVIPYKEFTCDQWDKIRIGVNNYQVSAIFKMTILGSGLLISGTSSSSATDPCFSNVVFLCHCNGSNNSTTFIDQKGKTMTVAGNSIISTAQSKFGGTSAYFDGAGDCLTVPYASGDFSFGTGDFCVECWAYPTAFVGSYSAILNTSDSSPNWYIGSYVGALIYYSSGIIASGGTINLNVWQHIAATRESGTLRLFIDGLQVASSSYTVSIIASTDFTIGSRGANPSSENFAGYIDEIRITKGVARYTANFIPPSSEFPDS